MTIEALPIAQEPPKASSATRLARHRAMGNKWALANVKMKTICTVLPPTCARWSTAAHCAGVHGPGTMEMTDTSGLFGTRGPGCCTRRRTCTRTHLDSLGPLPPHSAHMRQTPTTTRGPAAVAPSRWAPWARGQSRQPLCVSFTAPRDGGRRGTVCTRGRQELHRQSRC